jgi:hypothetical protein
MMIDLTPEEREMLLTLVEREIVDLGPEIRHTRTQTYREDLKAQQQTLRSIFQHLREPQPAEHV